MRRYWYTTFLLISLIVGGLWLGGKKGYEYYVSSSETQADAASREETEEETAEAESTKAPETQTEEETQTQAQASVEETGQQESEPTEEENNMLFPENFQGVLFIGDSRTVGLYEYGELKEADVFAHSGMSVFNLWDSEVEVKDKGKKTLEQLLSENSYQGIHLMLGINELGYKMDEIVNTYRAAVEKIQSMQPQAKVILGANLHVTTEKSSQSPIYNNQNIDQLNSRIQQLSQDLNCYYVNVNEKFDDQQGGLSTEYSVDGSHILGKYYADWVSWLQNMTNGE